MKRIGRKVWALAGGLLVAAGVTTAAFLLHGEETAESVVVSAGIQQLADQAYLACSAPVGAPVAFDADWFDTTLRGAAVNAVTLTRLPPATEGELLLGHAAVTLGQVIPRETLSYLSFSPREGVRESSFGFTPATSDGNCGYELTCRLRVTDAVNCCPAGTKSVTAVSTHERLTLTGSLLAEDPEGDALRYEICTYPANGTVSLDAARGVFTYRPDAGFSGGDRFTWRVQDENGAFSEESAVEVTVRALTTGYLFADMPDAASHSAALRVTEAGLMGGEMTGGKHYFHPDRELTRAAYVAILLRAAEIQAPDAAQTGFRDDADIPAGMKGAIRYAREQGWLGEDEDFRPNDAVTRAEAARIAAAVLGLSAPGYAETVRDFGAIPVEYADALYALYEGGYLFTSADGSLRPQGALTRGDAARFFSRVLDGKASE